MAGPFDGRISPKPKLIVRKQPSIQSDMKTPSLRQIVGTRQSIRFLLTALLVGGLAPQGIGQVLEHRYDFNQANGSLVVPDLVGSAPGTVNGAGNFDGSVLHLDGTLGEYVDFGPNLISAYTNITVEGWVSFENTGQYTRFFDFGDTLLDGSGPVGMNFGAWSLNGAARFEVFDTNQQSSAVTALPNLNNKGMVHIATVYDPQLPFMALYVDGVLKASRTDVAVPFLVLTNNHSWLGRSGFTADEYLNGSVDEMRIYRGVRSSLQIAVDAAAGPNQVLNGPGTLARIHLSVPNSNTIYAGISAYPAVVTGDFDNVSGVNLSFTNVVLTSGNPAVLVTNPNGLSFDALKTGATTLIASFGDFSATQTVSVLDLPATLTHQYHFGETAGSGTFLDVVGSANGTVIGAASLDGSHLVLPGGPAHSAYAELPPFLISNYVALTFEFWLQFGANPDWGRLIDFGDSNPGTSLGRYCIDFTPHRGGGAGVNFEVADADPGSNHTESTQPNPNLDNRNVHLVLVYNPLGRQLSIYTNGVIMGQNTNLTIQMNSISNVHSWLGQSSYLNDPEGVATIDEFRIYNGVLSPFRVALNAISGPTNYIADPGTLTNLHLTVAPVFVDERVVAAIIGDYQNAQGINLSFATPTLQSGNTNLLKVGSGLTVAGMAPGSTTLIASYGGLSVTQAVTVLDQAPAVLTHRYSFNGPAATSPTTFADSVGGADGTLVGTATVDGAGKLVLTGNSVDNNNYAALPPHLLDTNLQFSLEAWVAFGSNPTWARFLGFGDTLGGNGSSYLDFIPNDGFHGDTRWETGGFAVDQVGPSLNGKTVHLVLVYNNDPTHHYMAIYTNGVLLGVNSAISPYPLNMTHCWLGKSSYAGDANGVFTLDEFRIYNGPLSARQIAANFKAGPNVVAQPPVLSIATAGRNVVLGWPSATDPAFTLETSSGLGAGASWSPVGTGPTVVNGTNQVTLGIGAGTAFYRLAK